MLDRFDRHLGGPRVTGEEMKAPGQCRDRRSAKKAEDVERVLVFESARLVGPLRKLVKLADEQRRRSGHGHLKRASRSGQRLHGADRMVDERSFEPASLSRRPISVRTEPTPLRPVPATEAGTIRSTRTVFFVH